MLPKLVLAALGLSLTTQTFANSKQLPDYDGAQPYQIITTDTSTESKDPAGIYRRPDDGRGWEMIVPGEALQEKNAGGVFQKLQELHNFSKRYEMISIVDGVITIFHTNSDKEDKSTFIRLGTQDAALFDPTSKEERFLPEIQDVNDVSLVTQKISKEYITLIFSIKFKEKQITGDGITFSVNVKMTADAKAKKIEIVGRPSIVDYQYFSRVDLNTRISDGKIVSDALVKRIYYVNANDPEALIDWKKKSLEQYMEGKIKWQETPYIDLKTGEATIPGKIKVRLDDSIVQYFDLVSGNDSISIRDHQISGRVDFMPGTKKFAIFYNEFDGSSITFVGNVPYYLGGDGIFMKLPFDFNEVPENLTFIRPNEGSYDFIISKKTSRGSETWVLSLKSENIMGKNEYVHNYSARLTNQFYETYDLDQRVLEESSLHFDGFTPKQESAEGYQQEFRETRAVYALRESIKQGRLLEDFRKPLESSTVYDKISYLVFDDEELERNRRRTGVYVKHKKIESFLRGKLLNSPVTDKGLWGLKSIKFKSQQKNYKIMALVMDQSFSENKVNTAIMHVLLYDEDNQRIAHKVDIKVPNPDQIESVQFIGHEENPNKIALGISLTTEEQKLTRTYLLDFDYDKNKKLHTFKEQGTDIKRNLLLSDSDWEKHIRVDTQGRIYWVVDPSIVEKHRDYELVRLEDKQRIYPNRSKHQDISFKLDSSAGAVYGSEAGGQWTVNNFTSTTHPALARIANRSMSKFKAELFGNLQGILADMASLEKKNKHLMLVVPPELKNYVYSVVLANWYNGENKGFSKSNADLSFNVIQKEKIKSQAQLFEIYEGFERMATKRKKKVFLLGDMEQIIELDRPLSEEGDELFRVEHIGTGVGEDLSTTDALTEDMEYRADSEAIEPHAIYLMSTEGEKLDLIEYEKRGKDFKRNVSTLIVTTEAELAVLNDTLVEEAYGVFDNFEKVEIDSPSQAQQRNLLESVFDRPDIRMLNYRFDASDIKKDEEIMQKSWAELKATEQKTVKEAVLGYLATRIRSLAAAEKMHPTIAIAQMIQSLGDSLVNDPSIRSTRVVDRVVVEKLLQDNFSMPLNLQTLPANDPLKVINSPRFLQLMQKYNHTAPMKIINQIKQIRLGQTRKDPTLAVPSSVILVGPSGTGKTSFWFALMKTLGSQTYDMSSSDNSNARAFYINLEKIVEHGAGNALTVENVLRHLDIFLGGPNGPRGDILVDDAHKASPKVRGRIFSRIFELMDSEDGMYRVEGRNGEIKEKPVVNLNITITMNPTEDGERLKKYRHNSSDIYNLPIDDQIVATFDDPDAPFDKSRLRRFAKILEFKEFPDEAKGPRLASDIKDSISADLESQNRLTLFTPRYIDLFISGFPGLDARTFLSNVTQATMQEAQRNTTDNLLIITPVRDDRRKHHEMTDRINAFENTDKELDSSAQFTPKELGLSLNDYVERYTQVLPLGSGGKEARFRLLELLVDGLRTQVYQNVFRAIGNNFEGLHTPLAKTYLPQFYKAMADHLRKHQYLPLKEVNMDPGFYGYDNQAGIDKFFDLIRVIDGDVVSNTDYFPPVSLFERSSSNHYDLLTNSNYVDDTTPSRTDVMADMKERLTVHLSEYLERLLHLNNKGEFSAAEWIEKIKGKKDLNISIEETEKRLIDSLYEQFIEFGARIQGEDLYEIQHSSEFQSIQGYDQMKLFLYTVDKAIARISWDKYLDQKVDILKAIGGDMTHAQDEMIKKYIFENRYSLIWPKSHDGLLMLIDNTESLVNLKKRSTKVSWGENRFYSTCENFLRKPRGGN